MAWVTPPVHFLPTLSMALHRKSFYSPIDWKDTEDSRELQAHLLDADDAAFEDEVDADRPSFFSVSADRLAPTSEVSPPPRFPFAPLLLRAASLFLVASIALLLLLLLLLSSTKRGGSGVSPVVHSRWILEDPGAPSQPGMAVF